MFERVYPRVRPHRAVIPGPVLASLAFHVVLAGVAGQGVPVYVTETVTEGIQYFAPVPVQRTAVVGERLAFLEMAGSGDGSQAMGSMDAFGDGPAESQRGREGADSTEGTEERGLAAIPELPQVDLDSVYFPDEVDNPAAYDPRSRAPAYPDSLQRLGIEGSVTAQFIVDTTGFAADSSLQIIDFTHQPFVQSLRDALPGMIFRPAEIRGEKIRQLVQQTFSFRMGTKPADSARSAGVPATSVPPPLGNPRSS